MQTVSKEATEMCDTVLAVHVPSCCVPLSPFLPLCWTLELPWCTQHTDSLGTIHRRGIQDHLTGPGDDQNSKSMSLLWVAQSIHASMCFKTHNSIKLIAIFSYVQEVPGGKKSPLCRGLRLLQSGLHLTFPSFFRALFNICSKMCKYPSSTSISTAFPSPPPQFPEKTHPSKDSNAGFRTQVSSAFILSTAVGGSLQKPIPNK